MSMFSKFCKGVAKVATKIWQSPEVEAKRHEIEADAVVLVEEAKTQANAEIAQIKEDALERAVETFGLELKDLAMAGKYQQFVQQIVSRMLMADGAYVSGSTNRAMQLYREIIKDLEATL